MSLLTICMPILPGKKQKWQEMMDSLLAHGSESRKDFNASREAAGVHERTFLHESPNGDFVILTFEGENPVEGWGKIMSNLPDDFAALAKELHGRDVNAPPPPLPTLIYDSRDSD